MGMIDIAKNYDKVNEQVPKRGRISKDRRRWDLEAKLSQYARAAVEYIGLVAEGKIRITEENLVTHQERYRACKYVLEQHIGKPPERVPVGISGQSMRIREIQIVSPQVERLIDGGGAVLRNIAISSQGNTNEPQDNGTELLQINGDKSNG